MILLLFLAHLLATLLMTGVIWVMQVVHYPLFTRVGEETWATYHAGHTTLISLIVLPAMIVEGITAVILLFARPSFIPLPAALLGLLLVILIWGATFFLAAPQHQLLAAGFDEQAHRLLVSTNWVRTLAWSGRTALLLWLLWKLL